MNTDVKAIRFSIDEPTQELIDKRLEKLAFAEDKIQDLAFTFTREKNHSFAMEGKIHFRWGSNAVLKCEDFDLKDGINQIMEKVYQKIKKEVDKKQDHK